VDDQDEIEIRRFYANLSTQIRMFGAEEMGRRYVVVRLARMEVNSNLTFSDLQRILARVVDAPAWYAAFHQEAIGAEERARDYASEGRTTSAADALLRSSACYHWGQYLARIGSADKSQGRRGRVRCYREAVELMTWARIEPFTVAHDGASLPGYLHLPRDAHDGAPACTIMVNGADSVKEEYHFWAREFVRRGIAVLTIDGPGQGEMVGDLPMRPEAWERPMSAAVDALARSGRVDGGRIGIWGSSMGGFLAARAAAFEPRLRAVVSSGGFYDFRDYQFWPLSTQLNVMEDLMVPSLTDARAYMAQRCSLEGVASRIEAPFLVIHGARDELVTVAEARRMAEEAPRGEFACFEDGYHTCTNLNAMLVPLMCDWMADKLA
jgi:dipeptidyl aminopeptidase/acylaminoacyl peptidase